MGNGKTNRRCVCLSGFLSVVSILPHRPCLSVSQSSDVIQNEDEGKTRRRRERERLGDRDHVSSKFSVSLYLVPGLVPCHKLSTIREQEADDGG